MRALHSPAPVARAVWDRWALLSRGLALQNTKGAGVEQRVLQALMAKRFPKIVAQLEKADTSVEVCRHSASKPSLHSQLVNRVRSARLHSGCP